MKPVGNRLAVNPAELRRVCSEVARVAEAALSDPRKTLAEKHNQYLPHVLLGLFLSSAGRPVRDPFHSLDLFDLERHAAILIDKVMDRSKEARLVVLPDVAVIQIQYWLDHLEALTAHLSEQNPALAAQIYATRTPGYPRPIPLFFLLKEDLSGIVRIGRKEYEAMLRPHWNLPGNFNRSCLATWLKRDGCLAELVDGQLGHVSAGNTPFGIASPLSPEEARADLQPRLERYLGEIGWHPLPGIRKPRFHRLERTERLARKVHSATKFGPDARAETRLARWSEDARFVQDIVRRKFPEAFDDAHPDGDISRFPREIPDSVVDSMIDAIYTEGGDSRRTLVRRQMLRRYLARLRRGRIKVSLPGRLATIDPEPSAFDADSFPLAKQAGALRERFIEYLSVQGRTGQAPTIERRIAEILVAAPLFSAVLWKRAIEAIPEVVLGACHFWSGRVFVDIPVMRAGTGNTLRRWFPDSLNGAQLLGLKRVAEKSQSDSIDIVSLEKELASLLVANGIPLGRRVRKPTPSSIASMLNPVLAMARAYWRLRLPGTLRAYAEGEALCASPPLHGWIRLSGGKRLDSSKLSVPEQRKASNDEQATIDMGRPCYVHKQGVEFWKELKKILSVGNSGKRKATSAVKRLRVAAQIRRIAAEFRGEIPPVATAIANWGIHLCRHGTLHKSELAISTICSYLREIGLPLIDIASDTDFLNLGEIGFTTLYCDVVESRQKETASFTAGRLNEFHEFLIGQYGVADADWDEIYPEEGNPERVDAGLLTEKEYLQIFGLLLKDPFSDERARQAAALLLLFAYRFGLRRGEIFRLLRRDVQKWGEQVVVIVNNNIYGETKSHSGVRQIPLPSPLTAEEKDVLEKWLASIDTYHSGESIASLFGSRSDLRRRIDLARLAARVTEVMRFVTGDPTLRLHHLRHSFANRLFLGGMLDDQGTDMASTVAALLSLTGTPGELRQNLTERKERSRRMTYATAVALGHRGPGPSLGNYIHLADVVLADRVTFDGTLQLRDHHLTYALQIQPAALRVCRYRLLQSSDPMASGIPLSSLVIDQARRLQWSNLDQLLLADDSELDLPEPSLKISETVFAPSDLDRLLMIARHRSDEEGLAERFHIDNALVDEIIEKAAALERKSGYFDFGVSGVRDQEWEVDIRPGRGDRLLSESRRARHFLNDKIRLEELVACREAVLELADLWSEAHHSHASELLFSGEGKARRFIELLSLLGIDDKQIQLFRPTDLDAKNENGKETPKWRALPARDRLPQRSDKNRFLRKLRLGVSLKRGGTDIAFQKTLNRVIFDLANWLSLDRLHNSAQSQQ